MAEPYQNATKICLLLTVVAILGGLAGLYWHSSLVLMVSLLPALFYEAYRTEGETTKWASRFLVVIGIIETIVLAFHAKFDLASFLGRSNMMVKGYDVPLGDISVVGPAILAVLSIILFAKTYGPYTKWLSVIIIIGSFAIVYLIDPNLFSNLARMATNEGLKQISY
ncbi:MAG: hypothetical protein WC640_03385 [Candidatus Paceibacterota bacterium]|jgi:hypothetical protein